MSALKLRSGYWTETVNPLNRFWRELTAFVQNRAFLIDNNEAERAVRSMPTARNKSFHFGSDLGAQMSATYLQHYQHSETSWQFRMELPG